MSPRQDDTYSYVNYDNHPPYCTCKECEERRNSTLTPGQRDKLRRMDSMISGVGDEEIPIYEEWELWREFPLHSDKLGAAFHAKRKNSVIMAVISHLEQQGYEVKVVDGYDSYKIMIR